MPNQLSLAGASAQKQPRYAPLFTSRFFSGIWTNRSPLRDASTSRIVEKFYGAAGDAIITGLNIEITNKLTLARRPGTTVFDTNTYDYIDRFYEFKLFNPTTEKILVMIDDANTLYSLYGGVRTAVFTKSAGAGQTYMQAIGNTLYFADGIDNKKYLQTLFTWTANTALGTALTPFLSTFMFDASGNILQLVGTVFPVTSTNLVAATTTVGPVLTIGSSIPLDTVVSVGTIVTFPAGMVATYLDNQSSTVISITGTSMVVSYPLSYQVAPGTTVETLNMFAFNGGTPTTGPTAPIATSGIFYNSNGAAANTNGIGYYTGITIPGVVTDGTALWVGRVDSGGAANSVENWGIINTPTVPFVFTQEAALGANGNFTYNTYAQFTAGNITGTTLSGAIWIIDTNGNIQTASSGTTGPAGVNPTWSTLLGTTTTDNTVTWTLVSLGTLTTSNGGWRYAVSLVNTLDSTVSNASDLSVSTGNFQGIGGIQIQAGSGLSSKAIAGVSIDEQADYVAIFRTTDGQSVPFLIPGANGETYTLPLSEYLAHGYLDTTPDVGLNNLISGPINGENTPPEIGAKNLDFYLGRIFYSVGNVVNWTTGPSTPAGNGVNGTAPLDFSEVPSLVSRLVATTSGMLVFTVSDVYIILGNGSTTAIQGAIPLLPGIGLPSYNALDMNGPIIGFYTSDKQFITLDPSSGTTYAGFPIGDQLRLNNGNTGQSWVPANVYVAWHVEGEDAAWYVCDGSTGWYRLMTTPAPETGYTWSPFAAINGGVKALQSVEVLPGVHKLLLGPRTIGQVLQRDLSVFSDFGTPYTAYATIGSIVLTQPGQVAEVAFITTDAVKIGSPLTLGILVDEALPYYTGPIDILKNSVNDPPNFKVSQSLYSQRFYLSNLEDETASMRHMQIQIIFSPFDVVANELLTMTVFGSYSQEL